MKDLSTEECLAYGEGYKAGLDEAKDQEAAKLIKERDIAIVQLAFERALRQHTERRLDEVRARCVELEAQIDSLRRQVHYKDVQLAGLDPL